jgi:hypothetical protein
MSRMAFVILSDAVLLGQCAVDTYRASGPGGQKRNKTSSAVRLRHLPTGLLVIAEESRSQHENKAKALQRLRRQLFLDLREPPGAVPGLQDGQLVLGGKHPEFWFAAGAVLDHLFAASGQVSTAAEQIGTTTGQLVGFLEQDPRLWQQANAIRQLNGLKPLQQH